VITAAAAIMVVVFLAFVFSSEVFLKLMGLGMATAILVDATIVPMVLVPAVMQLLGWVNWWIPRWARSSSSPAGRRRRARAGRGRTGLRSIWLRCRLQPGTWPSRDLFGRCGRERVSAERSTSLARNGWERPANSGQGGGEHDNERRLHRRPLFLSRAA
jgi:hypothetical protein